LEVVEDKEVRALKLNNGPEYVVGTCGCPICERNASLSGGGEERQDAGAEGMEVDRPSSGRDDPGPGGVVAPTSEIWKAVAVIGVFGIFGLAWYFWKESKKDQAVRRRIYESGRGNY
jgi:hypothetical protein